MAVRGPQAGHVRVPVDAQPHAHARDIHQNEAYQAGQILNKIGSALFGSKKQLTPLEQLRVALDEIDEATALKLIRSGIIVNFNDDNDQLPLIHRAAQKGFIKVVNELVKRGVDKNLKSRNGIRAVDYALHEGHVDIVEALLEPANVNTANHARFTPLAMAARNGDKKMMELLIKKGARLEDVDPHGKRACDYARDEGIKLQLMPRVEQVRFSQDAVRADKPRGERERNEEVREQPKRGWFS